MRIIEAKKILLKTSPFVPLQSLCGLPGLQGAWRPARPKQMERGWRARAPWLRPSSSRSSALSAFFTLRLDPLRVLCASRPSTRCCCVRRDVACHSTTQRGDCVALSCKGSAHSCLRNEDNAMEAPRRVCNFTEALSVFYFIKLLKNVVCSRV